jgi:hypothetical protein
MTDEERRHIAEADRHIAQCTELIARQKELIRRMAQRGQSTEAAEATLETWQTSLGVFERHRELIVSRLDAKK